MRWTAHAEVGGSAADSERSEQCRCQLPEHNTDHPSVIQARLHGPSPHGQGRSRPSVAAEVQNRTVFGRRAGPVRQTRHTSRTHSHTAVVAGYQHPVHCRCRVTAGAGRARLTARQQGRTTASDALRVALLRASARTRSQRGCQSLLHTMCDCETMTKVSYCLTQPSGRARRC